MVSQVHVAFSRLSCRSQSSVSTLFAIGIAGAAPVAGIPALSLNRAYTTAPFAGTDHHGGRPGGVGLRSRRTTRSGSWMPTKAYEVDASTDALRRVIPTADFTNALPVGGVGAPAGTTRSRLVRRGLLRPDDRRPLRLLAQLLHGDRSRPDGVPPHPRCAAAQFQVESYQSLPAGTDPKGAGYRAGVGHVLRQGRQDQTVRLRHQHARCRHHASPASTPPSAG